MMNTTTPAPKPVTAAERARHAADLLAECLWSYDDDADIAAVILTAVVAVERLARRRGHRRQAPR
jgi:hypothetical protein